MCLHSCNITSLHLCWVMLLSYVGEFLQCRDFVLGLSWCELQSKALGKLGNIVAVTFVILDVSSNVSMFAHTWKHCCGNKICFLRSKNVSYQIQKHLMFPYVSH